MRAIRFAGSAQLFGCLLLNTTYFNKKMCGFAILLLKRAVDHVDFCEIALSVYQHPGGNRGRSWLQFLSKDVVYLVPSFTNIFKLLLLQLLLFHYYSNTPDMCTAHISNCVISSIVLILLNTYVLTVMIIMIRVFARECKWWNVT